MAQFAIRLSEIDDDSRSYTFPVPASWLSSVLEGTDVRTDENTADGSVAVTLYRSGDDIVVKGTAKAPLTVDCSRCLGDVRLDIEAELMFVMSPQPSTVPKANQEEIELDEDELGREYYGSEEIVLDEIVRDHLLLEIPMQPRCVDPPCPEWVKQYMTMADDVPPSLEVEPDSTTTSGIDPRLAPLLEMAKKLKPSDD